MWTSLIMSQNMVLEPMICGDEPRSIGIHDICACGLYCRNRCCTNIQLHRKERQQKWLSTRSVRSVIVKCWPIGVSGDLDHSALGRFTPLSLVMWIPEIPLDRHLTIYGITSTAPTLAINHMLHSYHICSNRATHNLPYVFNVWFLFFACKHPHLLVLMPDAACYNLIGFQAVFW